MIIGPTHIVFSSSYADCSLIKVRMAFIDLCVACCGGIWLVKLMLSNDGNKYEI